VKGVISVLAWRVATAIVGGPAVILAAWWGGIPLAVFCLLVSVAGIEEVADMFALKGVSVSRPVAHFLQVACLLSSFAGDVTVWAIFPVLAGIVSFSMPVLSRRAGDVPRAGATFLTVMYVPYLLGHLMLMRGLPGGERLIVYCLCVIWGTDTAAYFAGTRLGRHRLCPDLSPKKSWEGAVAGLIAGLGIAVAMGPWAGLSTTMAALLGVVAPVFGEVGDLFESALKRYAGVKDSGRVIPGHGGALDRFDSLLFTAPAVYWLLHFARL